MAGESAGDMARRAREKAERLNARAERWEAGCAGEVATAAVLDELPRGWFALHDVAWPGRPRANIEHVVIGPGGIFVVDSKNWSGNVTLTSGRLSQNGRSREKAVAGAADAALAIASVAGPLVEHVEPVLCFTGRDLAGRAREVAVRGTDNLLDYLLTRPVVLGARQVADARRRVDHATSPPAPGSHHFSSRTPRATRVASSRPGSSSRPRRESRSTRRLLATLAVGIAMLAFGPWALGEVGAGAAKVIVPQPSQNATCTPTAHPVAHSKQGDGVATSRSKASPGKVCS